LSCPEGCNGCQLINGKVSCLACKDGYSKESEGLHLTCDKNLAWWAWMLIILGILLALGIIGAVIMMMGKKKKAAKDGQYNEYEMNQKYGQQNNNPYQQNVSMD
jgi:hypothetical protein